jgi:3-methyl-2-oxobutanoate hydroxymethyltransferase
MNPLIQALMDRKARRERIAVLTAYDYPTAKLLEECGVDLLLVGDSLGMVVLGYEDTTLVTMDEMLHHTRAVARGVSRTPILADLPINSYNTPEAAVQNGRRLLEAGAHAVKLEGGTALVPQIAALHTADIPVMAHIGMMPQHVREEGGYKIKGKTAEEAERLLADAKAVEAAGSWGLLLELVRPDVAKTITDAIRIPTIGIGAGPDCDGQVLVTPDLVGGFPWFTPRFVKPRANIAASIREAVGGFIEEVKA